jgi:hypothetical protein
MVPETRSFRRDLSVDFEKIFNEYIAEERNKKAAQGKVGC